MAGLVQSSFFWGYALSQLPGGWLSKIFGGRFVFFIKASQFLLLCLMSNVVPLLIAEKFWRLACLHGLSLQLLFHYLLGLCPG